MKYILNMRLFVLSRMSHFCPCLLFCVILQIILSGLSDSSEMSTAAVELTVQPEENITLSFCNISASSEVAWYRQSSDKTTLLIRAKRAKIGKRLLTLHNEDQTHFKLTADREITMTNLTIVGVRQADLGLYFCETTAAGSQMQRATRLQFQNEKGKDYLEEALQKEEEKHTGGVSVVERGLMFGGVVLAALVFLLATVAAFRVVYSRA